MRRNLCSGNSLNASFTFHSISNTSVGSKALFATTTGSNNTAIRNRALRSNTTGSTITVTEIYFLYSNTNGYENVATGMKSLYSNTWGFSDSTTPPEFSNSPTTSSFPVTIHLYAGWLKK